MNVEFVKEVTFKEAIRFLDEVEKRGLDKKVGLMTEWGAVIFPKSKLIVDISNYDKCYIATIGMLQKSDDGIFVRLMTNGKKEKMPNFHDIFKVVKL